MMTPKQVVLKLQEEKHYRSIRAMEIDLGFRVGFLSDILRGSKILSAECATKIISKFPDINRTWLLTGEGYVYNDQAQQEEAEKEFQKRERIYLIQMDELKKEKEYLKKELQERERTINKLSMAVATYTNDIANRLAHISPMIYKTSSDDVPAMAAEDVAKIISKH